MKGLLFFLIFSLFVERCIAEAGGFDGWMVAPFLSYTAENSGQTDDDMDILYGIGLNVPLSFNSKKIESNDDSYFPTTVYVLVEPMISAEYSFYSDLFRIRTGAYFGQFHENFISIRYYAGFSGSFIQDFANDASAFGIAPEIGFELILLLIGLRFQLQYDFYTIERYNRFVFTTSIGVWLPEALWKN